MPRPTPTPTPTPLPDPFVEDDDRLAPVSGEITEAPALPEPPPAPTTSLLLADTTMIVKPLPSPRITDAPRAKRPSEPPVIHAEVVAEIEAELVAVPRRTKLVIAAAGAVAAIAVIALAIGFAGGGATVKESAAAARPVAAATPEPTPVAVEAPAVTAPTPQPIEMIDEPAPAPVIEAKSAPPPRTIAKRTTAVAKSPPIKRTRKPAPKWNPDSLFPAKK